MSQLLTHAAERAHAQVMYGLAYYREQVATRATATRSFRARWTTQARLNSRIRIHRDLAEHDAVLRAVAIAEDFSLTRLVDLTEGLLPPQPLVQELWRTEQKQSLDTWPRRLDAWKRLHNVRIKAKFPARLQLLGFIEARNAIAHGLGELTKKQRIDQQATEQRLENAGIKTTRNRIILKPNNIERCAEVVGLFIVWLDVTASAASRFPRAA
jgi:hypothetical protein